MALLSPGLLLGISGLSWAGAAVRGGGLGAHLAMLAGHLRRRRRRADLFLAFVATSAGWLVAGAGLALAAELFAARGAALATAAVVAFAGWLLEALAGHALRVVPLISWPALRHRPAVTPPPGGPSLYIHSLAAVVYCLLTSGIAAVSAGFAGSLPVLIAVGGGLLAAAGIAAAASLSARPLRMSLRPEPAPGRHRQRSEMTGPSAAPGRDRLPGTRMARS